MFGNKIPISLPHPKPTIARKDRAAEGGRVKRTCGDGRLLEGRDEGVRQTLGEILPPLRGLSRRGRHIHTGTCWRSEACAGGGTERGDRGGEEAVGMGCQDGESDHPQNEPHGGREREDQQRPTFNLEIPSSKVAARRLLAKSRQNCQLPRLRRSTRNFRGVMLASASMDLLKGGAVLGPAADLAGKVALITGSTAGIGMHVAIGYVSRPERDCSNGGPPLPRRAEEPAAELPRCAVSAVRVG